MLHWGAPTAAEVERIGALTDEFLAASEKGLMMLVVIEAGAPMIGAEAREAMERSYASLGPAFVGAAQVVEETGFAGAALRGVFQALALVTGKRKKLRIFGTVDEALRWIEETHPSAPDTSAVRLAVGQLRERRPDGANST